MQKLKETLDFIKEKHADAIKANPEFKDSLKDLVHKYEKYSARDASENKWAKLIDHVSDFFVQV